MALMQSCCCWRSVRRGSFACALYTGIYFALLVVTTGTTLNSEHQYMWGNHSVPKSMSVLEPERMSPATIRFNVSFFVCSSFGVVSCVLLVFGLLKDRRLCLLPWIINVTACSLLDVAHSLYLVSSQGFNPTSALMYTLSFFLLCLNVYSLLCVISQYQEYVAGRGRAIDDCEHRMALRATPTGTGDTIRGPTDDDHRNLLPEFETRERHEQRDKGHERNGHREPLAESNGPAPAANYLIAPGQERQSRERDGQEARTVSGFADTSRLHGSRGIAGRDHRDGSGDDNREGKRGSDELDVAPIAAKDGHTNSARDHEKAAAILIVRRYTAFVNSKPHPRAPKLARRLSCPLSRRCVLIDRCVRRCSLQAPGARESRAIVAPVRVPKDRIDCITTPDALIGIRTGCIVEIFIAVEILSKKKPSEPAKYY